MSTKPDFSKYPYRGIHSEIARKLGITRQAVHKTKSPALKRMILQMVKERQKDSQEFQRIVGRD